MSTSRATAKADRRALRRKDTNAGARRTRKNTRRPIGWTSAWLRTTTSNDDTTTTGKETP